ncbi:hypothetical protein M408DRAFT_327393 [Serendipita vermifera MAFF 305830]|uniref:Uncharacterized protein n=1 Tax=Serendipita vermifera MAFF 305830 TaxID=933852 RepID=A0A0C2XT17_SERVB|nr:hypothetical protein M408DRAFT_327393 [Serendipita vermifera MAFF 305830]
MTSSVINFLKQGTTTVIQAVCRWLCDSTVGLGPMSLRDRDGPPRAVQFQSY